MSYPTLTYLEVHHDIDIDSIGREVEIDGEDAMWHGGGSGTSRLAIGVSKCFVMLVISI